MSEKKQGRVFFTYLYEFNVNNVIQVKIKITFSSPEQSPVIAAAWSIENPTPAPGLRSGSRGESPVDPEI